MTALEAKRVEAAKALGVGEHGTRRRPHLPTLAADAHTLAMPAAARLAAEVDARVSVVVVAGRLLERTRGRRAVAVLGKVARGAGATTLGARVTRPTRVRVTARSAGASDVRTGDSTP